jgi:hypothetical protein
MAKFLKTQYLKTSDPLNVKYLNVNESSTLLFKSSCSNDFHGLKSFDSSREFNKSVSGVTGNEDNHENIYFQISKYSRSDLTNSIGSKYYERLNSSNTDNNTNNVNPNNDNNLDLLNKNTLLSVNDLNSSQKRSSYYNLSAKSFSQGSNKSSGKKRIPAKINLLSNQQERMRQIEKLMAKNVILTPIALIFSIIIAITLFISIFTDYYEYSYYDINALNSRLLRENNKTLINIENEFIIRNKTLFRKQKLYNNSENVQKDAATEIFELVDLVFQYSKELHDLNYSSADNRIFDITFDNLTLNDNRTYIFYKLESNYLNENDSFKDSGETYNRSKIPFNNAPNDFHVLSSVKLSFFKTSVINRYYIYTTYSGLWQTCNFLSG